jgi:tyrosine-protein kinase Etk/Wzc
MNTEKTTKSLYLTYLEIILNYKKFIAFTLLSVGLVLFILLFFIIKPVFLSTGTLKTVSKGNLGLSGLLVGASLPDIGGLDELGGGSGSKELALFEQILLSRRCLEDLIIKYNLVEQYDYKYMEDALKDARENLLFISKNIKSGTITVGFHDYSPEKSKEMTEYLFAQLNKINIEMNVQYAKNNRAFVEERYNLVKSELKKAEDSLKTFQDMYGIAPDVIAKATTQASITMEAELKSEEIKLELLKKLLSPDQTEIKTQEAKIEAIKSQIIEIDKSEDPNLKLKLKDAPQKVLNYLRLVRNIEIQNKLLMFLLPIFEQAKIEEVKETPTVLVLDPPSLPEKKVKPKRLTILLIGLISTFLILTYAVVFYELRLKAFLANIKNIK